jgi:hypothetical protein
MTTRQERAFQCAILYDLSNASHAVTPEYLHLVLRGTLKTDAILAWQLYVNYVLPHLHDLARTDRIQMVSMYRSTSPRIHTGRLFRLRPNGEAFLCTHRDQTRALRTVVAEYLAQYRGQQHLFQEIEEPDGFSPTQPSTPLTPLEAALQQTEDTFDPAAVTDERKRVLAEMVQRQGQPAFRERLLDFFDRRCAMTGCDVVEVLEAAHIVPYQGDATNHPTNGLLLRADIHTLFDLGLLVIDSQSLQVQVAPALQSTSYGSLQGTTLHEPRRVGFRISRRALEHHRAWAQSLISWKALYSQPEQGN